MITMTANVHALVSNVSMPSNRCFSNSRNIEYKNNNNNNNNIYLQLTTKVKTVITLEIMTVTNCFI